MKNRYSLFKKGYWEAGVLLGLCLLIASCGEKEFTTDMPENKLITAISLEVSSELPVQLGTDTTIVYHITPENADHTELKWTTTNELVATVSQDGTISAKSLGKTMITVTRIAMSIAKNVLAKSNSPPVFQRRFIHHPS